MTATLHLTHPLSALTALPSVEHLFAGARTVHAVPTGADDKIAGTGDSAGRATNRKANGGHDARNGRDGG